LKGKGRVLSLISYRHTLSFVNFSQVRTDYVLKVKEVYLPGNGTSQTKALPSNQCLSAQPGPNSPFACTTQFSASLPPGSPGSHSENGIGDPSTHTYRPSVERSCSPIQASVTLDSITTSQWNENYSLYIIISFFCKGIRPSVCSASVFMLK